MFESTKRRRTNPASVLTFNHAMIYSRNVPSALHFYSDLLGFKVLEEFIGHASAAWRLHHFPAHGLPRPATKYRRYAALFRSERAWTVFVSASKPRV
jgi:catechol 2,3-dioxygenase-like lactoylglutathione lyase family enzyme